jgi:hypothetical protein
MVPELEREVLVGSAETADEVVFEHLYRLFCSIYVMVVWLNELDCSVLLLVYEVFDGCYCLIISDIKGQQKSFVSEDFEDGFECGHDVIVYCGCDGDGEDVVRIISISNNKNCWPSKARARRFPVQSM